jgi:hypothetical protein
MTPTADPPSFHFGATGLDALLPAILLSSLGFRLHLITSRQVAAAGDCAGSNLIKLNQTKSNQCAHASRPLPKETYAADLDDPLRKGIQS